MFLKRGARRRVLLALAPVLLLPGCAPGTVEIAFDPKEGATYGYEIEVESSTTTLVEGEEPSQSSNSFTLTARHEVERTDSEGTRVRVRLHSGGNEPRQLLVRLDRAAQLTEVIQVEGLPAEVLGELGLSEIFPAAVGAPPEGPLRPGATWDVDDPVQIPGSPRARLTGTGRLEGLDVIDGREVAIVRSSYRLPISRTSDGSTSSQTIDGTHSTRSRTTYDVSDGSVVAAEAESVGRFTLELRPPGSDFGPELSGSLEVRVRSVTRRVS